MPRPIVQIATNFLFIFIIFLCACSQGSLAGETRITIQLPSVVNDGFPRIDGSTSTAPLGSAIICAMMEVPCEWMTFIDGNRYLMPDLTNYEGDFPGIGHQGTHTAYLNLIAGTTDLILVARNPSAEELDLAQISGVTFDIQPIARDAFVFIVNENNPIEGLTINELRAIYSGEVADWAQVGGPSAKINAYQRDDQSGSQQLMESMVMKGTPMIEAPNLVLLKMIAPFYAVSEDPLGIGYSVFYYEENMAPKENIKLLAVDGIQPEIGSIQGDRYPFTSEVYAVIRTNSPTNNLAWKIRDWLLSPMGQELVSQTGYATISD
jgi:phosphate transport system substrate-binding protein